MALQFESLPIQIIGNTLTREQQRRGAVLLMHATRQVTTPEKLWTLLYVSKRTQEGQTKKQIEEAILQVPEIAQRRALRKSSLYYLLYAHVLNDGMIYQHRSSLIHGSKYALTKDGMRYAAPIGRLAVKTIYDDPEIQEFPLAEKIVSVQMINALYNSLFALHTGEYKPQASYQVEDALIQYQLQKGNHLTPKGTRFVKNFLIPATEHVVRQLQKPSCDI